MRSKAALARRLAAQDLDEYFDLEAPSDLERLVHPMTTLPPLVALFAVDEVRRNLETNPPGQRLSRLL